MFTTDTPGAHEFSIASSAATPPKEAPYPTLVGTAITGRSTSPAITLGSAGRVRAGADDVGVGGREPARDGDDLIGRLALTEDGLGRAGAQVAVLVDLRESEILERKLAEPLQRLLDGQALRVDVLEEPPDVRFIHAVGRGAPAGGSRFPTGNRRDRPPRRDSRSPGTRREFARAGPPPTTSGCPRAGSRDERGGRDGGRGTDGSRGSAEMPRPRPPGGASRT